jgi:hypothetical protein
MFNTSSKLDRMLSKCIRFIEENDWTIEDCLREFAPYKAELEPMLRTAIRLRDARELSPSSTFQRHAQARIQKRIQSGRRSPRNRETVAASGVPRSELGAPYRLRLAGSFVPLLLAALITFSVGGGIAYAADQARPGQVLFEIDRVIEQVRIRFEKDMQQTVRLHLQFADERIDEMTTMIKDGDTEDFAYGLAEYRVQIAATAPLIANAEKSGQDVNALVLETSARISNQQIRLEELSKLMPDLEEIILATVEDAEKIRKIVISPVSMDEPVVQATPGSVVLEPQIPTQQTPTLPTPTPHFTAVPNATSKPSEATQPLPTAAATAAATATPTPPTLPDLVSENLVLEPQDPEVNMVLKISGMVKNQGTLTAGAFGLIFCVDSTVEACYQDQEGDVGVYYNFASLAPGASEEVHTYSWLPDVAGEHTAHICADIGHKVPESDESAVSNCTSKTFTVFDSGLKPDLTITALDWPLEAYAGDDVIFFYRVSNIGTGTADAGYVNQLFIDGQLVPNIDPQVGTWDGSILVPGGAESNGFVWHATCGKHPVTAKTDTSDQLLESDEENNTTISHAIVVYCPTD